MKKFPEMQRTFSRLLRRLTTRVLVLGVVSLAAAFSIGWYVGSDSVYFKINKSLETFGEVFRHASTDYVDDVDPEQFVRSGLDAMLSSLDPYTVYMDQEQSEDFDSQVSGQYIGLGIQVGTHDSMLTITGIADGYSAHQAGLRVGDRLLSIDDHRTLTISSKELRKYTRGQSGTIANVRILRDGIADTLEFKLMRREIYVRSVSFIGMLNNGVGVIKLDRFTRKSVQEMRMAIDSLKSMANLRGIILDLRDNPGGLLDAAIGICELFVKNGTTIVTTKGRASSEARVFTSSTTPYEGDAPMVVLVNGSSASASEVVAGCIQDVDRGVICGEQSFGKGLVQSQFTIPYGTTLKMTTQRYYCPSGRCVQRIDYSKKRLGTIDTATAPRTFRTLNKRIVRDGSGVAPDTTMKDKDDADFVKELTDRDLIFRFANEWSSSRSELPAAFNANALIDDLDRFAAKQKFSYQSSALKKISEAKKILSDEKFSAAVTRQLEEGEAIIQKEQQKMFRVHTKAIAKILDREIRARFCSDKQLLNQLMKDDDVIHRSADLAVSESYRGLLHTPVASK